MCCAQCGRHAVIRDISFAEWGLPSGECGSYKHGTVVCGILLRSCVCVVCVCVRERERERERDREKVCERVCVSMCVPMCVCVCV